MRSRRLFPEQPLAPRSCTSLRHHRCHRGHSSARPCTDRTTPQVWSDPPPSSPGPRCPPASSSSPRLGSRSDCFFIFADLSFIMAFAFFTRMSDDRSVSILFRHSAEGVAHVVLSRSPHTPGTYPCSHVCRNLPFKSALCGVIRGASSLLMSCVSSSVNWRPGPFFTLNSGKSPSASLSPPPLFHGTTVTHSKLCGSHRCSSGMRLSVQIFFTPCSRHPPRPTLRSWTSQPRAEIRHPLTWVKFPWHLLAEVQAHDLRPFFPSHARTGSCRRMLPPCDS